jgi:hypothetical protein
MAERRYSPTRNSNLHSRCLTLQSTAGLDAIRNTEISAPPEKLTLVLHTAASDLTDWAAVFLTVASNDATFCVLAPVTLNDKATWVPGAEAWPILIIRPASPPGTRPHYTFVTQLACKTSVMQRRPQRWQHTLYCTPALPTATCAPAERQAGRT